MGYYTDYELCYYPYRGNEEFEKRMLDFIADEKNGLTIVDLVLQRDGNHKWYSHDEDMLRLSKEFPMFIFELEGNGEEIDDRWRSYYKDGKMVTISPTLIWPDFNEGMLK